MAKIVVLGEVVYKCNVCNRKIRVAENPRGLSTIFRCTITAGCKGKLTQVLNTKEALSTPTIPVEVTGVSNWFQRKQLYTHTQAVPMKKWTINHNLSNNPIFDVLVDTGLGQQQYQPVINTIDQNTTELLFDKSFSGIAQAISLSSQRPSSDITKKEAEDMVQISNDSGLLTVATLSSSATLKFDLFFVAKNNSVVTLSYQVDNQPNAASSWADAQYVYINGRNYTVRSIDTVLDVSSYPYFANGDIQTNSSFVFNTINNLPIDPNTTIILLSNSPHGSHDKVYNKAIFIKPDMALSDNTFVYSNGKLFASSAIIKNIYPFIHIV